MGASPETLTKTPVAHKRLQIHYIWPGATDARLSVSEIIEQACETAGISVACAVGKSRERSIAYRRFQVMAILRARQWSLPMIGAHLGGRDHTTVMHGLNRWEEIKRYNNARYAQRMTRTEPCEGLTSPANDEAMSCLPSNAASPDFNAEKSL